MGRKAREQGFYTPFASLKATATAAASTARIVAKVSGPPASPPNEGRFTPSDQELFAAAMADCERHEQRTERLIPPKRSAALDLRPSEDDEAIAELEALVRGEGSFRIHEGEEVHTGLAPGVSYALLDALMAGSFAYHHCLDLHGMVREQAREALVHFIGRSRCELGASCVLVVTGRGRGSPMGHSVLREALPRWLSRQPIRAHILAFCTARAVDGGPGAFYILLRRQGVRPFCRPALLP